MVNSKEFSKRLEKVMNLYDLSAAAFADKINVGRSSISHILSGRNKPSLDFVMKIIEKFPEVELYWLLNGKGIFPKSEEEATTPIPEKQPQSSNQESLQTSFFPSTAREEKSIPEKNLPATGKKKIHKIVIFYEDGSFEAFEN